MLQSDSWLSSVERWRRKHLFAMLADTMNDHSPKIIFAAVLLSALASAVRTVDLEPYELSYAGWQAFKKQNGKNYETSTEENLR